MWAAFFPPHVGGYEKNILELSRRLVERGHHVDVVTCQVSNSPPTEVVDGVMVRRISSLLLLNKQFPVPLPSKTLLNIFRARDGHDIVITQTRFFVLSFVGAIFSVLHGLPLIHVERGSRHTIAASPLISFLSKVYDHSIGCWVMWRAKQVIGVSRAACEFAQHLGARSVARIPNGININGNGTTSIADSILYVGRLIQAKGVQDLIEAHKYLNERVSLVIVGDGPYREHLREMAGDNSSIQFTGELSGEHLVNVYRSASIFVNPSYSEGLPTAVMEAAVFGIPVVATDVGGTKEIIQTNITGLLVEPGNANSLRQALSWMLDHKGRARQMARVCRERVLELYSWNKVTNQYCELLERVCESK